MKPVYAGTVQSDSGKQGYRILPGRDRRVRLAIEQHIVCRNGRLGPVVVEILRSDRYGEGFAYAHYGRRETLDGMGTESFDRVRPEGQCEKIPFPLYVHVDRQREEIIGIGLNLKASGPFGPVAVGDGDGITICQSPLDQLEEQGTRFGPCLTVVPKIGSGQALAGGFKLNIRPAAGDGDIVVSNRIRVLVEPVIGKDRVAQEDASCLCHAHSTGRVDLPDGLPAAGRKGTR